MSEEKSIITFKEAFDLGEALINPTIRSIRTSGFGIAVVKNFRSIQEEYKKFHKEFEPTEEFDAMIKEHDVKSTEEYEALRNNPELLPLIEARDTQMEAYNEALQLEYPGNIQKVKLNNTTLGLSADDIESIELMLEL